jgi:signal transduction protein with GAF and PtsI domain
VPRSGASVSRAGRSRSLRAVHGGEREDRLWRLQALTDAALVHFDLGPLLAALLERTKDLLETDTCAILLLDEERAELVARAAFGIDEEVERGVRIPLEKGFAGRVAADNSREPVSPHPHLGWLPSAARA